jgi:bifunctional DNase/RNase
VVDVDGNSMEIDSRPSDAVALAVRVGAPIFVSEQVMSLASITPEEEISADIEMEATTSQEAERLSAFRDFVDSLDLDDLGDN